MGYIEVARRGYDLRTASDSDKLFSSKFPSLLIAKRYLFTVNFGGGLSQSFLGNLTDHGLNYIPCFFAFKSTDNDKWNPTDEIYLDESSVYVIKKTGSGTQYFMVYLFFTPMFEFYKAPNVAPTGSGKGSIGGPFMKIARNGHSVEDEDLRNFVIHPNSKTLSVHQTGFVTNPADGTGNIDVEHGLTYAPLHMIYLRQDTGGSYDGKANMIYYVPNSSATLSPPADGTNLTIPTGTPGTPGDYAYLILKDPIL